MPVQLIHHDGQCMRNHGISIRLQKRPALPDDTRILDYRCSRVCLNFGRPEGSPESRIPACTGEFDPAFELQRQAAGRVREALSTCVHEKPWKCDTTTRRGRSDQGAIAPFRLRLDDKHLQPKHSIRHPNHRLTPAT